MRSFLKAATVLILLFPLISSAAGIQVSPAKLDFTTAVGKTASQNIIVVNPTADVQVFEVYADDFSAAITADPESFTLESGSRKTVAITVDTSKLDQKSGQSWATDLSVVGKPLADNKFSVGTGVKLPLTISIGNQVSSDNKNQWLIWTLVLALLIMLLAIYNYKMAKRVS